ncbi:MAG TPA: hypothetical protein VK196_10300, partial [Magnetospirillum sp.]|nr:hypothetical protein [Magnetospirillum sp.]
MRKAFAFLWLAVALAACAHLAVVARSGLPVESDLMALLPREDRDADIQAAKTRMAETLSRRVVVMVGHAERPVARAQATRLRQTLADAGLIRPGDDIPSADAIRRLGAAYFPHRAGLLAEGDRERLRNGQGEVLVTRALSQVYGFAGPVDSRLLAHDPFLLFPAFMTDLPRPASKLMLDDGMLTVTEAGTNWIMVSMVLAGESTALDMQRRFGAAFDGVRDSAPPGTRMLRLGALFYAKAGAEQAMDESTRIGLVSLAGTVLLLLAVFRSGRPLALSLLAIAAGMATALSACLALFGTLHVAAQLFGASLIGVAVDYALFYFGQIFTDRTRPAERLSKVAAGISVGAATTIIGYATLALSPFPGLKQVAVFSAVGLTGSLLTVMLWFPLLDRTPPARLHPALAKAAAAPWRFWGSWGRAQRAALAVLALLALVGAFRLQADDDVRRQQGLSPVLAAEQAEIQRLAGFGQTGQFFLVAGSSAQQVLEREEALGAKLAGRAGWQAVARYVPSARRQADNAALAQRALIEPHLQTYRDRLGMAPPAGTATAEQPLAPQDILATGALPFLDTLTLSDTLHVVTLDGVGDTAAMAAIARDSEGVR